MKKIGEYLIRVMVAEDIDILREDFCEIIGEQEDMEIAGSAASGQEIVKLAIERKPDIVLMDIEMETLTAGIDAAEQIHSSSPGIKIIFMTAHETDDMIHSGMGTGAVDYIVKGCDDEVLLEHIRRAYDGTTVLDSNVSQSIMKEYNRLRKSEQSLVFFINNVSHLTNSEREIIRLLLDGRADQGARTGEAVLTQQGEQNAKHGLLSDFGGRTGEEFQNSDFKAFGFRRGVL